MAAATEVGWVLKSTAIFVVGLLLSALSITGAFRVDAARAVRVADLLQGDGKWVYAGAAPVSGLP